MVQESKEESEYPIFQNYRVHTSNKWVTLGFEQYFMIFVFTFYAALVEK